MIAGLIRGIPNEYIAYGVDPSMSWERFEEAYDLVLRAWTEPEPFGWEGKHYQFRTVSIWPRPLQQPHPPILMSGGSGESAAFAARKRAMMGVVQLISRTSTRREGLRRLPRRRRGRAGWEPPAQQSARRPAHLGGAHAMPRRARRWAAATTTSISVLSGRAPARQRAGRLTGSRYYQTAAARAAAAERRAAQKHITIDDRIEQGTVLCGSPDTVVRQIEHVVKALGIGHHPGPVQDRLHPERRRRGEHAPLQPRGAAPRPRAVARGAAVYNSGATPGPRTDHRDRRAVDIIRAVFRRLFGFAPRLHRLEEAQRVGIWRIILLDYK